MEHELATFEELQFQAWRDGDLAEVRRVSKERREFLGLNAPTEGKVDASVIFRVIYDKPEPSDPEPSE